jgi:hypothetical protein
MNKLENYKLNFFISCFPFANSIARVVSGFVENSNIANLEILELYSYPGIFTRNIFISLRDLGIGSRTHYIIHEEKNPEELQSKCSVESLGVNYEFSNIYSLKAIENSTARILILNDITRTQPELDLELIIKTASKNKNIELILGAELIDLELRGIKDIENYYLWQFQSNYLTHYAYIKTELNQKLIIESLEQEFKINNNYEKFFDLTKILNSSKSPQFCEFSQSIILDEYIKLDGYSANCHILIAKYLSLMGNNEGYQEHLKKARLLDTHKLLKIH